MADGANKKLKEKARGYSNALNAAEYENALDTYYTNKRNEEYLANLKNEQSKDQWKANEKIRQLQIADQVNQFDKNQNVYETTVDAIKFSAEDARERVKLGLDEQIAEFAFQYDDLERDMFKEAMDAGMQYDQKQQSLESARLENRVTQQEVKLERAVRKKSFEEQIKQNDLEKKQTRSDYRKNQMDLAIENLQAQGRSRAMGQTGKSAQRALSTASALNGVNQQQLEDNLYYSQEALNSQRRTIEAERKAELGTNFNDDFSPKKKSIKQSAEEGGRLGLQSSASRRRARQTKKQVRREQKYISETLGITQEEFEMSREKLAESLQSAAAQSELKLKNIKTKEFEALGSAYAQRMVRPRFGDAAPVPYKTPIAETIMPKPAPKTPMMANGMGRGMSRTQSGFSTAAGIGSAALAIGAGFATGGTATALMGASGLLGGLSSLFG